MSNEIGKNESKLRELYTTWLKRDIWTAEEFIFLLNGDEPFYDPYDDSLTVRQEYLESNHSLCTDIVRCIPTTLVPVREGQYPLQHRFRHSDLIEFAIRRKIPVPSLLMSLYECNVLRGDDPKLFDNLYKICSFVIEQAEKTQKTWLQSKPEVQTGLPFNFPELLEVYETVHQRKVDLDLKEAKSKSLASQLREDLKEETGYSVEFCRGNPHGHKNRLIQEFPDLIAQLRANI